MSLDWVLATPLAWAGWPLSSVARGPLLLAVRPLTCECLDVRMLSNLRVKASQVRRRISENTPARVFIAPRCFVTTVLVDAWRQQDEPQNSRQSALSFEEQSWRFKIPSRP